MKFTAKALLFCAGVTVALSSQVASGASSFGQAPTPRMVAIGGAPAVPPGAHLVGTVPGTTPVHLDVVLKPRDPAALATAVASVSDPGSPEYHHFLATGQFDSLYGPLASTVSSVRASLKALGLSPSPTSPNALIITVQTTASAVQGALRTHLARYNVAGRVAFANTSAPSLPASVVPYVQAVIGLDTVNAPHPMNTGIHPATAIPVGAPSAPAAGKGGAAAPGVPDRPHTSSPVSHTAGPVACSAATQAAAAQSAWTDDQLASAYGFTTAYANGNLGSGQTIALYELEPYATSDVTGFETCYGISTVVTPINVDGGPPPGPGSGESILDIDNLVGLAPAATILVYQGPNGSGLDVWNQIVNDNRAKVVSTSWGICESLLGSGQAQSESTIFSKAALQGQSIVDASGDAGSEDCYSPANGSTDTSLAVDDPGSQPDITSVGGTSLTSLSPLTEQVWNNCLGKGTACASSGGAGGGGISTIWTMPSWQTGTGVLNSYSTATLCNGGGSDCREVPDVSAVADSSDGYMVYCVSCNSAGQPWGAVGGTSAAAPLWGALVALANEACGSPSGLLNPTLYPLAASHPADFNDITSGNNDLANVHSGAYPATAGFDMASGLGTPTSALFLPGALCGSASPPAPPGSAGYWMLGSGGTVYQFGSAVNYGSFTGVGSAGKGNAAGIARTADGKGYWVASTTGVVQNFGDAPTLTPTAQPSSAVVTIAGTPDGQGFWLATDQGQIVIAGDAVSFGDLSGKALNAPIVNMVPTPDGLGYWLLGGDGGVFTFGDAGFFGSTGNIHLNQPAVAMTPTVDGLGYWFVASDGGIFTFGDAKFFGSMGAKVLAKPVNGMVVTSTGKGYWMVASDGGVFSFGDAVFVGSLGGQSIPAPIVGITPD